MDAHLKNRQTSAHGSACGKDRGPEPAALPRCARADAAGSSGVGQADVRRCLEPLIRLGGAAVEMVPTGLGLWPTMGALPQRLDGLCSATAGVIGVTFPDALSAVFFWLGTHEKRQYV